MGISDLALRKGGIIKPQSSLCVSTFKDVLKQGNKERKVNLLVVEAEVKPLETEFTGEDVAETWSGELVDQVQLALLDGVEELDVEGGIEDEVELV